MRTIIIDGNNLCYMALTVRGTREAAGVSEKDRDKEIMLSVIQGFLAHIQKLSARYNSNKFIFTWDVGKPTRRDVFPDYKGYRRARRDNHKKKVDTKWGPPPHLGKKTFQLIRTKILPAIGFRNILSKKGFEADDIIASLVNTYSKNRPYGDVIVVSSDKDLYQLLDQCSIFCFRNKQMNRKIFRQQYLFVPKIWPFFRALTGDVSDSIPGIAGVGPTLATKFITKSLGKQTKSYKAITCAEGKAIVRRNIRLMTLPYPGTGTFKMKPDELSFEKFLKLANRLSIEHLLTEKVLDNWRTFFDMD